MLHEYWIHNISPYIFRINNINLNWLFNIYWAIIMGLIVISGIIFSYKIAIKDKPHKYELLISKIFSFMMFVFILLGIAKYFSLNIGMSWFVFIYAFTLILCFYVIKYYIKKNKFKLTEEQLFNIIQYCIVGMLIGSRLTYVLIYNFNYYKNHLFDIIKIWEGGLSFHGGVLGVIIAIYVYAKKNNFSFFHITDKLVILIPIAIAFGQIANFINGDLYGRVIESHVPWAIIFPSSGINLARHPSQLYQSLSEGFLLFFTLLFINNKPRKEGTLSSAFIFFYAIYRFPIEYFREADKQLKYYFYNMLTMGQILCIIFAIFASILFVYTRKNILEYSNEWKNINQ